MGEWEEEEEEEEEGGEEEGEEEGEEAATETYGTSSDEDNDIRRNLEQGLGPWEDDDSDSDGDEVWRRMLARNLKKKLPCDLVDSMTQIYDTETLGETLCYMEKHYDTYGPTSPEWQEGMERLRVELMDLAHARGHAQERNSMSLMD